MEGSFDGVLILEELGRREEEREERRRHCLRSRMDTRVLQACVGWPHIENVGGVLV